MTTCSVPVSSSSKSNITIYDSTRQNTWCYLSRMPFPPSLGLLLKIFNCLFLPRAGRSYKWYYFIIRQNVRNVTVTKPLLTSGAAFRSVESSWSLQTVLSWRYVERRWHSLNDGMSFPCIWTKITISSKNLFVFTSLSVQIDICFKIAVST